MYLGQSHFTCDVCNIGKTAYLIMVFDHKNIAIIKFFGNWKIKKKPTWKFTCRV